MVYWGACDVRLVFGGVDGWVICFFFFSKKRDTGLGRDWGLEVWSFDLFGGNFFPFKNWLKIFSFISYAPNNLFKSPPPPRINGL